MTWQPISTAIKNNGSRLVWCPDRRNTYVVVWGYRRDTEDLGWVHFGGHQPLHETPTHWQPLPPPPTEGQEGEDRKATCGEVLAKEQAACSPDAMEKAGYLHKEPTTFMVWFREEKTRWGYNWGDIAEKFGSSVTHVSNLHRGIEVPTEAEFAILEMMGFGKWCVKCGLPWKNCHCTRPVETPPDTPKGETLAADQAEYWERTCMMALQNQDALAEELGKQYQKAQVYGSKAQKYRDECLRRGAPGDFRLEGDACPDDKVNWFVARVILNTIPAPAETDTAWLDELERLRATIWSAEGGTAAEEERLLELVYRDGPENVMPRLLPLARRGLQNQTEKGKTP